MAYEKNRIYVSLSSCDEKVSIIVGNHSPETLTIMNASIITDTYHSMSYVFSSYVAINKTIKEFTHTQNTTNMLEVC